MKEKTLKKSEIRDINSRLKERYGIEPLSKKDVVVTCKEDDIRFLKVNDTIKFFYYEEELLPVLKTLQEENFLKKITVDMGAVKFVASGADIMKPGVKEIDDDINKDEIITIIDEQNHKPLALGKSLYSSEEMKEIQEGKVITTIHYVGDKIWKLL